MAEVAARELRNDTAGVLRRAEAGEDIVITVRGKPVAQLSALRPSRRRWMPKAELIELLNSLPHDPTLAADLAWISGGPDDLDPIV